MREGLKYLEDLHVLEHQHQHAQRLLMMQQLLRSSNNPEGLAEMVSQACAGLRVPGTTETQGALPSEMPDEANTARQEARRAAEGEAALQAALKNGTRSLPEGPERDAMVRYPSYTEL